MTVLLLQSKSQALIIQEDDVSIYSKAGYSGDRSKSQLLADLLSVSSIFIFFSMEGCCSIGCPFPPPLILDFVIMSNPDVFSAVMVLEDGSRDIVKIGNKTFP